MTPSRNGHITPSCFSRRHFVAALGATTVASPLLAQDSEPAPPAIQFTGPKIKLGIVGCGGRGAFMEKLFRQHGG